MIRAMFFTCGLFTSLCGLLLLCVDRIVLTESASRAIRDRLDHSDGAPSVGAVVTQSDEASWQFIQPISAEVGGRAADVIDPPDWGAVALISVGCVTVLYACSLPGRRDEEGDDSP